MLDHVVNVVTHFVKSSVFACTIAASLQFIQLRLFAEIVVLSFYQLPWNMFTLFIDQRCCTKEALDEEKVCDLNVKITLKCMA